VHSWNYPTLPGVSLKRSQKEPPEETKRAEKFLAEAVQPFRQRYGDVEVHTAQHQGAAAENLIRLSDGAERIVLGVRRENRRLGLQVGPVVNAVLQHAACSVVLVPVP
jgi:nucleotide-binding universal stress UspA family protein